MATVFERVRKVAAAQLGITEAEINTDTNFATDLEADSLDMVEMMMALEDEFYINGKKITIPDEESEKLLSVRDIVNYVHSIGISDTEAHKGADKGTLNIRKPSLPRPAFRKPWQQRQDKGTATQNQQPRPNNTQQHPKDNNQIQRDNRPQK